jgi:hypothetical protein
MTIQIQEFDFFIGWVPTSISLAYILVVLYYTYKFNKNGNVETMLANNLKEIKETKETMQNIQESNQQIIQLIKSKL